MEFEAMGKSCQWEGYPEGDDGSAGPRMARKLEFAPPTGPSAGRRPNGAIGEMEMGP